jgi:L-cysteine desulfidase
VGVFPHLDPFGFAHLVSLIQVHVAGKAEGCTTIVMRLQAAAFAITELVGVSRHYRSILSPTLLARGFSQGFQ